MKYAGKTLVIGRSGTEVRSDRDILPYDVISRKLSVPNIERIFLICRALRTGPQLRQERNLCRKPSIIIFSPVEAACSGPCGRPPNRN
jgi:hypothetical protein